MFPQLVTALHRSDVAQHSHPSVLMLYYDTAVRYVKILKSEAGLVLTVMRAMCSSQGE